VEKALKNLQLLKQYHKNLNLFVEGIPDPSLLQPFSKEDGEKLLGEVEKMPFSVLVVYGIGGGKSYPCLKQWLKKGRYLIYLEDDRRMMEAFLAENDAEQILKDPHVVINFIGDKENWGQNMTEIIRGTPPLSLSREPFHFSAPTAYQEKREYKSLRSQFFYTVDYVRSHQEFFDLSQVIEENVFHNLLQRPGVLYGKGLKDCFQNIPAVVCGAGASIENDLDALQDLETRALIFAGGSSLNVLSSNHIRPHIALGIDPTHVHVSKIAGQTSFEVPYFYYDRIHHEGLRLVQAPRVYIGIKEKGKFFSIESWFDKQFGLEEFMPQMGYSVATAAVALADYMGCDPIILSGVDLAHTDERIYATGVEENPLYRNLSPQKEKKDFQYRTVDKQETRSQFIKERDWFIKYARSRPEKRFNRTPTSGLGMPEYAEFTLSSLRESHGDLRGKLHEELYRTPSCNVEASLVKKTMKLWLDSMQRVADVCRTVEKTVKVNLPLAKEEMDLINGEPAYLHWLHPTDNALQGILQQYCHFWVRSPGIDEDKKRMAFRARNLRRKADRWLSLKSIIHTSPLIRDDPVEPAGKENLYESKIRDGVKVGKAFRYYPTGTVYADENYMDGLLHGEQKYFSPQEVLLTRLFYREGRLEGKAELYYPDGSLKRTLTFKEGRREGKDEYYHESGQVLFSLEYQSGRPIGIGTAWYDKGQKRIEIKFSQDGKIETVKEWTRYGHRIR